MRPRDIPLGRGSAQALEALLLPAGGGDLARAAVLHLADIGDAMLIVAAALTHRARS